MSSSLFRPAFFSFHMVHRYNGEDEFRMGVRLRTANVARQALIFYGSPE